MLLEGVPDPVFGFHAQQAVEKLLKALLSERNLKYARTHNLETLIAQLETAGEALPHTPLSLKQLNSYAVEFRYEDPIVVPPPLHKETIQTVQIVREFVQRRVQELNPPPTNP
jgi:HEPN domain-containing protein